MVEGSGKAYGYGLFICLYHVLFLIYTLIPFLVSSTRRFVDDRHDLSAIPRIRYPDGQDWAAANNLHWWAANMQRHVPVVLLHG